MSKENISKFKYSILKTLKNNPTHGYELFIIFKEKGLINQPSDIYKILRNMKKKGWIKGQEKNSAKGPTRIVLSLTEEGLEVYFSYILDSMSILEEIMMDIVEKVLNKLDFRILGKMGYNSKNLVNKNIFCLLNEYPLRFQVVLLNNIFSEFKVAMNVYLPVSKETISNSKEFNKRLLNSIDNKKINLQLIDENFSPNSETMDLILTTSRDSRIDLQSNFDNLTDILTKNGTLMVIATSQRPTFEIPMRLIAPIIMEFLKDIPKKMLNKINEYIPSIDNFMRELPSQTNDEILSLFQDKFKNIKIIFEINELSVIVGRKI